MNEQKFPWAMDTPIEEIAQECELSWEYINYLFTRLKKTESERDELANYFCKYAEKYAFFDKCGQTYYDAKKMIKG